jgi:Methane oxygenase PmoA
MRGISRQVICGIVALSSSLTATASSSAAVALPASVALVHGPNAGRVAIIIDGLPVAVYCYQDHKISRPFFAHVRAPGGVQVTRHHPPIEGQDLLDHDTMHPGIWMAFGDINGSDYWRLAARVRHAEFVSEPVGSSGLGTFAVRNEYLDQRDPSKIVCEETARYTISVRPGGYLLQWDSTFSGDHEFAFGDQEEMGIGIRVATPLRVGASGKGEAPRGSGTILDSAGRKNEKEVWGNSADWCDYSGTIAGRHVGITIFSNPDNFRPSWHHARDYGFVAANPFGRKAFGKGEASKVVVKPGEKLRLRFGIWVHSRPQASAPDLKSAYAHYLEVAD